jgi:short-subunit dehydrogenase
MEVNFFAAVHLTTLLLGGGLIRERGQLVVLSSVTGYVGTPKRSSYAASKHALQGYFNALRAELHRSGIGVTVVCPGFVDTGIDLRSLRGDGSAQAQPDTNRPHGMSAEKCAERTLKAVRARKREVYVGKEAIAIYLQRFFPGLVHRLAHGFAPETDQ